MAPRTWKRPLSLIYDNNYRYGTNLYSGAIDDIERKYLSAMSRTHLPVDRPDVAMSTFAGSSLTSGQRAEASSSNIQESSSYDLRKVKSVADFDLYRSLHDWTPTLAPIPSRSSYMSNIDSTVTAAHEAEERRSRRRRRRRAEDMDRLDMYAITSTPAYSSYAADRASEKMDTSFWMDKCRHFQSELDALIQRTAESEAHVKSDALGTRSKIQSGINELAHELEDTTRQSGELQKVIKKQAHHLAELQSLYDEVQRQLMDATEELCNNQRRCHNLQSELDSIRHSFDQASSNRSRVAAW